jgi:serine/threonine protein phosphatase 1
MRHLIIGDIHGCYQELQDLLDLAALATGDAIIALGDILDRGPDPLAVLQFFSTRVDATTLYGNHEDKHVRWFRHGHQPSLGPRITRHKIGEAVYPKMCAFLENLPRSVELPEAILVHGLFEPGVALRDQPEEVIVATRQGEERFVAQYGERWFDLYDGDKPLIVGHHDYDRTHEPLVVNDRVYAIDTGCCYGGRLSGLLLPEFRFLSVPARRNHWAALQVQYAYLA